MINATRTISHIIEDRPVTFVQSFPPAGSPWLGSNVSQLSKLNGYGCQCVLIMFQTFNLCRMAQITKKTCVSFSVLFHTLHWEKMLKILCIIFICTTPMSEYLAVRRLQQSICFTEHLVIFIALTAIRLHCSCRLLRLAECANSGHTHTVPSDQWHRFT